MTEAVEFWALGADRGSNVAHAYRGGKAACGSHLAPSRIRYDTPGCIACKKCRIALLKETGQPCDYCRGKGRHCITRVPTRRYLACGKCYGLGYVEKEEAPPFIPPPPPATRRKTRPLPFLPGQSVVLRNHVTGQDIRTLTVTAIAPDTITAGPYPGSNFHFYRTGIAKWSSNLTISPP